MIIKGVNAIFSDLFSISGRLSPGPFAYVTNFTTNCATPNLIINNNYFYLSIQIHM